MVTSTPLHRTPPIDAAIVSCSYNENALYPTYRICNTCVLQPVKNTSPSKVSEESKENWNGGSTLPLCSSVTNTDSRSSMIPPIHDLKSSIPSVSSLTCLMPPVSLGSQSDLTCLLDDEGSKNTGTRILTYAYVVKLTSKLYF